MEFEPYDGTKTFYAETERRNGLSMYIVKTFGWLFLGLMTTFLIAVGLYFYYLTHGVPQVLFELPTLFILLGLEMLSVYLLVRNLHNLSSGAAILFYFAYAALNAITFSTVFLMFKMISLILCFVMAAVYFAGMALYGYFTKSDLSSYAPYFSIGAIVLAIFWGLSIFINLSAFETGMCFLGILVFMGYTAIDMQKVKAFYYATEDNQVLATNYAIYGALQLYLDFVNLFLYLLRLFGSRRD